MKFYLQVGSRLKMRRTAHVLIEENGPGCLCSLHLNPDKWLLVEALPEGTHLCKRCERLVDALALKALARVDCYVLYQDIEDRPRQVFTRMTPPKPGIRQVEAQVVPDWVGEEPVYIRWHRRELGGIYLHLLTYTHAELKTDEIEELVAQAYSFIQEGNR
jgi:hypothetical protein